MGNDVNFNELTANIHMMDTGDLAMCVENLREIVKDGKAQWDKVAAILQVDGDNVDAVFARVRVLVAGVGGIDATEDLRLAREAFPAFAELYRHMDAAVLFELERFNRHCDELADMSMDEFLQFKRNSVKFTTGTNEKTYGPRRWWRTAAPDMANRTLWQRIGDAIMRWAKCGQGAP